ncbi:MAG: hypothetical protein HQM08_30590 [Candidatus Riflebacteria bacterium]|nr:hypothetical protein [Candidatus Riflebacteria bacterium]
MFKKIGQWEIGHPGPGIGTTSWTAGTSNLRSKGRTIGLAIGGLDVTEADDSLRWRSG